MNVTTKRRPKSVVGPQTTEVFADGRYLGLVFPSRDRWIDGWAVVPTGRDALDDQPRKSDAIATLVAFMTSPFRGTGLPSEKVRLLAAAIEQLDTAPADTTGAALDVLDYLITHHAHVAIDEAHGDGHEHVVMFVDEETREALRSRLMEPDMVGVGYTAFLTWALRISRDLHDIIARAAHDAATDSGGCRHTPGAKPACEAEADLAMAAEGSWMR